MRKLRTKLAGKLRSRRGESIAEVLVATLISAVALVLLASMIASSTNLIQRSENKLEAYYAQNNELAVQDGSSESAAGGKVTVSSGATTVHLRPDDPADGEPVKYFINTESENTKVVSYRYDPTT